MPECLGTMKEFRKKYAIPISKARDLDPSDTIVAGMLKDVEGKLGIESIATPAAKAPAPAPASSAPAGMPGMPSDPAEMERMLDQITPEQMQQQAAMLESMDPAQLQAMGPQFAGMDPSMVKSMSKMMGREIDESQLEQMQKMMSGMKPEDMQKWAGRAQKMASAASVPMAAYKKLKTHASKVGNTGAVAILVGLLSIMFFGHLTGTF